MKKPLDVIAGLRLTPFTQVYSAATHSGIGLSIRSFRPSTPPLMRRDAGSAFFMSRFIASVYWFGRYKNGAKVPGHAVLIIAALSLSACSSPAVRVQYIETKTYIPYPATLTQPISIDLSNATWGSAVGDLKAGLQTCDGQLQAIKDLKIPPKTP